MYKKINGVLLAEMLEAAKITLYNSKEELNALNVFPVPDGDTGTNMSLTFNSAVSVAKNHTNTASAVLDSISMAALRGARGNSGVILSQLLRGMSRGVKSKEELGIEEMVVAFQMGTKTAYNAIMKPTEGTILTVFRMMSEHLAGIKDDITDLEMLFIEAVKSSKEALELTTDMLPKLKQAGVVDSGGKGVVYIIEGMANYFIDGKMPEIVEPIAQEVVQTVEHNENVKFTYCTEFIIMNKDGKKNELAKRYEHLGDSIVVVADEDIVKVHIHTNDPGIAISEALKIGSLVDIKIDNMKNQTEKLAAALETPAERQPYAFVAIASGEGFTNIFKELGINYLVSGGQSMNPSSDDILNVANKTNADVVYIFPNNKNIILAAEQASELYDGKMVIIPTKNMSDVLSCMVGFSENVPWEENLEEMTTILSALKSTQITYAVRDSIFDDIEIKENEIMGLSGSNIVSKGKDVNRVTVSSIDKLIDHATTMITVYAGADISSEVMGKLETTLNKKYKDLDISFYRGDQPIYYYLVCLE